MFKRKGGGPFEQCSKKLHFSLGMASLKNNRVFWQGELNEGAVTPFRSQFRYPVVGSEKAMLVCITTSKSSMCKFRQQSTHPEVFAPINGWPLNTFLVLSGFTWARNVTLFVSIVELYGSLFEYCLLVGAFYPGSSCIWCGSKWYWLQQCVEDVPHTHYKDCGVVSRYLCDVQSLISILQWLGWCQ